MNRIIFPLLVAIVLVTGCQTIANYDESDTPLFSGSYAGLSPASPERIKVIS